MSASDLLLKYSEHNLLKCIKFAAAYALGIGGHSTKTIDMIKGINKDTDIKDHSYIKKTRTNIKLLLTFFLLSWLFFLPNDLTAQTNKNIVTQYNGWYMYFGNHRVSEKLSIHTEYQWRRHDWITDWQQSLLRAGLDWHVNNAFMLTGGYGWIKSFPYGEQPIPFSFNEHRIWQQLVLQQNTGRLYFHHRYRLEQRFLESISADTNGNPQEDGYNFRNRARYRLFLTVPLSRSELKDNTLFIGVYDEVFLGFGKGIGKNILDQNRLYFALGWRFNKDYNIQLGYLNHYVVKADGINHERNHTLQIGLTYNLDLRKKKL